MTGKARAWAHADGMRKKYHVSILARAWCGTNRALGFSGARHDKSEEGAELQQNRLLVDASWTAWRGYL